MKFLLIIILMLTMFSVVALAETTSDLSSPTQTKILMYTIPESTPNPSSVPVMTFKEFPNYVVASSIQYAISTLTNSIKGTCAKEIEATIGITGEGKAEIGGGSLEGALKLTILNPDISKACRGVDR